MSVARNGGPSAGIAGRLGDALGIDLPLAGSVVALLVIGLNMVYSASYVVARNSPEFGSDSYFLTRQLTWVGVGAGGLVLAVLVDYRRLRLLALPALLLAVVLLAGVLFTSLGRTAYGAQRWITLGPLPAVQPSEFAKLALILFAARWLATRGPKLKQFRTGPLPYALLMLLVVGLVMAQPDFGSGFVVVAIAACMFFLAGARMLHLLAGVAVGGVVLAFVAVSAGYRAARLAAFFDQNGDPFGANWHAIQASIALGSGGAFGLGLGASRQKFYYLFGAHTDSIYAVIGEEVGLLGTLIVLGLYVLIAYRGYRIALAAPDMYGSLLAAGVTSWLAFQALINIGVATNSLPFTGLPLPLVSFGGSSLVVSLVAVGLLLSVSRHTHPTGAPGGRPAANPPDEEAFE